MKKINNKGFLLVETLVVSTFCLTVLVLLFLQFKNLVNNYNNSFKYNPVEGIYNLGSVKKYLNTNSELNLNNAPYILISNKACNNELNLKNIDFCHELINAGNFKTIIYTNSDLTELKKHLNAKNDDNISQGLKDFINHLENKKGKKRLIAEFNNDTYASIIYL